MKTSSISIALLTFGLMLGAMPAHSDSLPDWIRQPNPDTDQVTWGMGSGKNLEAAKQAALTDVAGKFNSKVQESIRHHFQQHNQSVNETFETQTQVDIDATSLSHFEVTQTDDIDGQIWVQVRLDKAEYAASLHQRWQHENTMFNQRLSALGKQSSLEQLVAAQEMATELKKLELLAMQLKYADAGFDLKGALSNHVANAQMLRSIRNQQSVRILNDNAPADFNTLITERLAESGIKALHDGNAASDNLSTIKLNARTDSEQDSRGAFVYRITLTIISSDATGKIIGSTTHAAKGRSYASADEAQEKAVASMASNLKRSSVRALLKLKG